MGEGPGTFSRPPTPAHIANTIFADPPRRFAGEGKKILVLAMRLRIRAMKRHGHAKRETECEGRQMVDPVWPFAQVRFAKSCSPDEATLLRLLCKLRRVRVSRSAERVGGSEIRGHRCRFVSPGFRCAPPGLRKNERKKIGGETPTDARSSFAAPCGCGRCPHPGRGQHIYRRSTAVLAPRSLSSQGTQPQAVPSWGQG